MRNPFAGWKPEGNRFQLMTDEQLRSQHRVLRDQAGSTHADNRAERRAIIDELRRRQDARDAAARQAQQ